MTYSPTDGEGAEAQPTQGEAQIPPSRRMQPWVVRFPVSFGLIAFSVLVFLLQYLSQQVLEFDLVLSMGAKIREAIAAGQVWRLITPIFIHIGMFHIFVNMYSLFALGPAVERFFGSWRMLAVYLISGVGGVALSNLLSPNPSAGASGAIFGLLGALVGFFYLNRKVFGRRGILQFRHLLIVALLNLFLGLMPGIDNWGHMGGLLSGAVVTYFLGPKLEIHWLSPETPRLVDHRTWRDTWQWILLAAAAVLLLGLMASYSTVGR